MGMRSQAIHFEERSPARGLCFTGEQMRAVDAFAIEQLGIPGLVLMEHAAITLRARALELIADADPVIVFIGPGNNGGDGSALARLLHAADPHRQISAIVLAEPKKTSDAGVNLAALRAMAKKSPGWLSIATELTDKTPPASLVVDAMFGSGLTRPLEGAFADAVEWIARQRASGCMVLAVDVPSGLDCDTGLPVGAESDNPSPAVRADHTLTLGGVKRGILLAASSEWTGSVSVGDLGLPRWLLERCGEAIEEVDQG